MKCWDGYFDYEGQVICPHCGCKANYYSDMDAEGWAQKVIQCEGCKTEDIVNYGEIDDIEDIEEGQVLLARENYKRYIQGMVEAGF